MRTLRLASGSRKTPPFRPFLWCHLRLPLFTCGRACGCSIRTWLREALSQQHSVGHVLDDRLVRGHILETDRVPNLGKKKGGRESLRYSGLAEHPSLPDSHAIIWVPNATRHLGKRNNKPNQRPPPSAPPGRAGLPPRLPPAWPHSWPPRAGAACTPRCRRWCSRPRAGTARSGSSCRSPSRRPELEPNGEGGGEGGRVLPCRYYCLSQLGP